ncbi:MAG: hypothetical protein GEU80_12190 [Dehalococcoidia bacterium]|nr:hypothetical protein [Dehalococcoidia bacterium]
MLRYAALWSLVYVFGRLPVRILYALGDGVAMLAWFGVPRLRSATREHMRRVLGDGVPASVRNRAARGCVLSAGRYYADFARYAHLPPEAAWEAVDDVHGIDQFFEAVDQGHGVILISAHLGNPEFIVQALGQFPFRLTVFTEPLRPQVLHDFVHRIRGRTGVAFVPTTLSGVREAVRRLKAGEVLAAVSDRDIVGGARLFPFFGGLAPMPSGAVELARRTRAPIVHGTVLRTAPGRYTVDLDLVDLPPPTGNREADVASGMHATIAALESGIRRAPDQWFVMSPIWAMSPRPSARVESLQ